jgi:hypothetical protein
MGLTGGVWRKLGPLVGGRGRDRVVGWWWVEVGVTDVHGARLVGRCSHCELARLVRVYLQKFVKCVLVLLVGTLANHSVRWYLLQLLPPFLRYIKCFVKLK